MQIRDGVEKLKRMLRRTEGRGTNRRFEEESIPISLEIKRETEKETNELAPQHQVRESWKLECFFR